MFQGGGAFDTVPIHITSECLCFHAFETSHPRFMYRNPWLSGELSEFHQHLYFWAMYLHLQIQFLFIFDQWLLRYNLCLAYWSNESSIVCVPISSNILFSIAGLYQVDAHSCTDVHWCSWCTRMLPLSIISHT